MAEMVEFNYHRAHLPQEDSYSGEERLAVEVIRMAIADFFRGLEPESYFSSEAFKFWCGIINVEPGVIRGRLRSGE